MNYGPIHRTKDVPTKTLRYISPQRQKSVITKSHIVHSNHGASIVYEEGHTTVNIRRLL